MHDNKHLKNNSTNLNLLYIEGKDKFRIEILDLLKEFFKNINVAKNAEESIDLFIKHHPQVVIMDIDVDISDFNWVETAMHLKEINPEVKIITLSKNDNQKFLLDAIDIGITKFLIKPIEHHKLLDVLEVVINQLNYEDDIKIFYTYLHSVYNQQKSMVMMIKDKKPLLANQTFLDFFNVESIHKFTEKYGELDTLFLKHGNTINNESGKNWFDTISKDNKKQYRILLKDKKGKPRHFLFKYHLIPEQKSYAILSFDDITELNLTEEGDTQTNKTQPLKKELNNIFKLLSSIQKNQIIIHVCNYYKGITIVNDGYVTNVKDGFIVLKTTPLQLKAMIIEGRTTLSSEMFPHTIVCKKVSKVNPEKQQVILTDMRFSSVSPASRKTIRLVPDPKYSVSIFIKEKIFRADIKIIDISLDSIRLKFDYVPTHLKKDDKVIIDMILTSNNKSLIINTEATLIREAKEKYNASLIFMFHLDLNKKNLMLKYISERQVDIINEFKALRLS